MNKATIKLMSRKREQIPVYSLKSFSMADKKDRMFQIEKFDANRHFQVKYPHRHDFFEVLFIYKGSGIHVIDGDEYEIEPPCIFFMSPGQAHDFKVSDDVEGAIFIFTSEFYQMNRINNNRLLEFPFFYTIQQKNPPLQLIEPKDVDFLRSLFDRGIEEVISNPKNYSVELLNSILDLILITCSKLYVNDEQKITKAKGHILVKRFFQLVEENYKKNLSVNEYADMLALTPNHLTQTVKQLTGKTSNEIVKAKQVLEIKRLLYYTNLSVTEISNQLNFTDQSYFTKFFKKETSMSPKQYRIKSMKNT